jgi:hypothetical protein
MLTVISQISKRRMAACALVVACLTLEACSTASTAGAANPDETRVEVGHITSKDHLTTVSNEATSSGGTSVGVGGGGIGGSGFLGAGLSFDLSRLFEKHADTPVDVYRYGVQLANGSTLQVDSTIDLPIGACVKTMSANRPGYPRLSTSNDCQ